MAKQERAKTQKVVTHFLNLLQIALQERDEARNELWTLLGNNLSFQPQQVHSQQLPTPMGSDHNILNTTFGDHNILNTTYSQFYDSSPRDCSLPNLISADSSNPELRNQQCTTDSMQTIVVPSQNTKRNDDAAALVYDSLIKGKPLPEKGRLLQAVVEAGPLLDTLLLAPLPQWKSPPPPTLAPLPLAFHQDPISNLPSSSNFEIHHNGHGPSQIPSSSVFEHC